VNAPLLIDQKSASLAAAERDVRTWAGGRRVFVSSLITDMPAERAAVRGAIDTVGATAVMFEDLGGQDITAEQAYLAGVRSSDIYVGMWGPRYGVRMPDGYSATHAEYLEAECNGLRLCLFVNGESTKDMDGPQRDLINGARNLYTTSPWTDAADLERRVRRRLEDLAAADIAPWVRVGRTIFRATEIVNDGRTITLAADIRTDAVHAELSRLRDQRSTFAFSSPGVARNVQLSELSTRTTSTIGHEERLTLTIKDQQMASTNIMNMSINGVPASEMTRRALSDGVFGTSLLSTAMPFLTQPIDPLQPLKGAGLDDSIVRPVARLLFSEQLLANGIASRIDSFTLGPSHQGSRRLKATWTPPSTYSAQPEPDSVSIDGQLSGL
jgi:hypothetical protein